MIPDVNSLEMLERDEKAGGVPTRLKAAWRQEMERIASHFGFDEKQKAKAEEILSTANSEVDGWFLTLENSQAIKKYHRDLYHIIAVEQSPESMPYEKANAYKARKELERDRKKLVGEIATIHNTYHDGWMSLATPEQVKAKGGLITPWNSLDWINWSTMWGMVLVGGFLMLGLLTPLAALGGCCYLLMFYLSMPPWPGLPAGPAAEGHYLYVNKNLIELIACLVIASTPNGLWIGLDALIFGRFGRDRRAARTAVAATPPATPTTTVTVPTAGPRAKNPRR